MNKDHDSNKPTALRCSFCGKDQSQVNHLVAGPSIYICNECISICNEIIADHNQYDQLCKGPKTHDPEPDKVICSFCRAALPPSRMFMIPERGQLCPECLQATRSALQAGDSRH